MNFKQYLLFSAVILTVQFCLVTEGRKSRAPKPMEVAVFKGLCKVPGKLVEGVGTVVRVIGDGVSDLIIHSVQAGRDAVGQTFGSEDAYTSPIVMNAILTKLGVYKGKMKYGENAMKRAVFHVSSYGDSQKRMKVLEYIMKRYPKLDIEWVNDELYLDLDSDDLEKVMESVNKSDST